MDWDWKEFAWDSCELELGLEVQKNEAVAEAEASVDLRLGGEVSSDSVEKSTPDAPKDSKAVSSSPPSSGSSKRSRLQNGSQNFSCLVDGCDSDLGDCREYHRRHRVCEKHSKTPVVLVGGKQQRFCQQCSRFHSVGEFDEVKRSCRKRLDGHNRRRRKPQPSSLFMAAEKFMYNYKGPRILHFGSPQGYMNPIMRNMWPSTNKTEAESGYDHHRLLYRIESNKHKQDKGHPLWQENGPKTGICNESAPRTPISQPILGSIAPSTGGKGNRKLSPDSKPGSFDSGCALYLLSNLQTQSSSELGSMQSSINCPTQSPSSGAVHFDAANTTNLHCNGMLQMGPDGLNMENEDSLTLPIFWE